MADAELAVKMRGIASGADRLAAQLEGESDWVPGMFEEGCYLLAERCVTCAGIAAQLEGEKGGGTESGSVPEA